MSSKETIQIGNYRIFPEFVRNGGQSTLLFGSERRRPVAVKVYGGITLEELREGVDLEQQPDPFWKKVRDHDYDATSNFGDIDPARFLSSLALSNAPVLNGKPTQVLSFGRESQTETLADRVSVEYLREGKIQSLDQRLNSDFLAQTSLRDRLKNYVEMLKALRIVHGHQVVHNDISPGQFLFLQGEDGGYDIQLIDFGMHIDLESLESYEDDPFKRRLLTEPTTLLYNSSQHLETFLDFHDGEKEGEEIIQGLREDPQELFERDLVSISRIGHRYLFGQDAVSEKAREKHPCFEEDFGIEDLEEEELQKDRLSRLLIESRGEFSFDLDQDIRAEAARYLLEAYDEADTDSLLDKTGFNGMERWYARQVRRRLDELATEKTSLDDVIEDLEYRSLELSERMTRRKFLGRTAAAIAGTSILIATPFAIHEYQDSPEHLRGELLEHYKRTGEFNPNDLEYFLKRALEEQISPALARANDSMYEEGEIVDVPRKVSDGRYQMQDSTVLSASFFPRFLLLAGQVSEEDRYLEAYEDVIKNLSVERSIGEGFRIFRVTDPLDEFLSVYPGLDYRFADSTIAHAERAMEDGIEEILEDYFVNDSLLRFFRANPSQSPLEEGFQHQIRTDSYYVVKPIRNHQSEKFRHHMELMMRLLVNDDRVYDKVRFNETDGTISPSEEAPVYNTLRDRFYAFALQQALFLDLLSDYHQATGQGRQVLEKIKENYETNMEAFSSAHGRLYPPEYLLSSQDATSGEISQLPEGIRQQNNLPYAVYLRTKATNPDAFDPRSTERDIANLLGLMDFTGEGVLPMCKQGSGDEGTKLIYGDYEALKGVFEWVKRK